MTIYQPSLTLDDWPNESRDAARLVMLTYGHPDEATDTQLIWYDPGPWKLIVATKQFFEHKFPAPHFDSVKCVMDYRVPVEKFTAIAAFDGSVICDRTAGEVSARCQDEQANFLALNLLHDIVTGSSDVTEARKRYAKEFLDYRRRKPTPYMERLRFDRGTDETADPDRRMVPDEDLESAKAEGKIRERISRRRRPGLGASAAAPRLGQADSANV